MAMLQLHTACLAGEVQSVQVLLNQGKDPCEKDKVCDIAWHVAVIYVVLPPRERLGLLAIVGVYMIWMKQLQTQFRHEHFYWLYEFSEPS